MYNIKFYLYLILVIQYHLNCCILLIAYAFTILEYMFIIKEKYIFLVKIVIVSYYINDYISDFI